MKDLKKFLKNMAVISGYCMLIGVSVMEINAYVKAIEDYSKTEK